MTRSNERDTLTDDMRDFYEERAGILEHDAGMTRQEAERLAQEMMDDKLEAMDGNETNG